MRRQKPPADLSREVARVKALLEEKDRLLAAFHRIGQIILASLDLEQILDNLAKQVVEAGIFRSLMVALVDEKTQSVEVVRSFVCISENGVLVPGRSIRSVSLTQNTERLRYALGDDNITAVTARTGEMQVIEDWNERFGGDQSPENCATKAAYFIPVKRGEQVLAVLATGSTPQQLEETLHRIEVMQPLLDQVAIALEHARLYRKLQESEAHYRLLAEHVTDVIWAMDLELHFTYVSPSVRRMRGYTAAEAQAQTLEEALTPDSCNRIRQALREGKEGSEKLVLELEYTCKDGSTVWTETALTFVRQGGEGPQGILGSSRDITERKKAERELEQQRLLVMRSDRLRSLGERAAGIAHELNQPLVGVRGLAEHLLLGQQRNWNLGQQRMREKILRIIEQADRMSHIIEHVRRFACEAGRRQLRPVDLNEVVGAGTGLLEAQLRSRKLRLVYDLEEGLPAVLANPFALEEVVLNLLTNARDAVEERLQQEGRADRRVVVRTRAAEQEGVSLEVEDRGCGIAPEVRERIFEPFFTTKELEKGTGLGLSISRSIVEELGGTLEIASRPGEGTTARVWLPAVRPGSQEQGDGGA